MQLNPGKRSGKMVSRMNSRRHQPHQRETQHHPHPGLVVRQGMRRGGRMGAGRTVDHPARQRLQHAGAQKGAGVHHAGGHAGQGMLVHFLGARPAQGKARSAQAHQQEQA